MQHQSRIPHNQPHIQTPYHQWVTQTIIKLNKTDCLSYIKSVPQDNTNIKAMSTQKNMAFSFVNAYIWPHMLTYYYRITNIQNRHQRSWNICLYLCMLVLISGWMYTLLWAMWWMANGHLHVLMCVLMGIICALMVAIMITSMSEWSCNVSNLKFSLSHESCRF